MWRCTARSWLVGRAAGLTGQDPRHDAGGGLVLLDGFRITVPAALEIATGALTGACYFRHSRKQFLAFLNTLGEALPAPTIARCPGQLVHPLHAPGQRWLERRTRVHFHFTLTGASEMNMVEICFSMLTKQQVRRGVYQDVPELIAAIGYYIEGCNERRSRSSGPRPPTGSSARPANSKRLQERRLGRCDVVS